MIASAFRTPANLLSKFKRSATIKVRVQTVWGQAVYNASKEGQRPREALTLAVAPIERAFNLTKTPRLDEIYAPPIPYLRRFPPQRGHSSKGFKAHVTGHYLRISHRQRPAAFSVRHTRGNPRAKRNTKRPERFLLIANKVSFAETDWLGESVLDRKPALPFP